MKTKEKTKQKPTKKLLKGRRIDKLKLLKYKESRLKGLNIENSLKECGYTPITARHNNSSLPLAKTGEAELMEELRASDVTADWLIKRTQSLGNKAESKADYSNALRSTELIARLAGLLIDKKEIKDVTKDALWAEFQKAREANAIDTTSNAIEPIETQEVKDK